ncbi:hypothetical protein BT93_L2495 [Corymbia citriodora subsp. variegata]|uniref:Peroxidase n=1 Tax=Corymbia citriodora subsp. variegata TaxID=360336 RepID=A0A8T0CM52_CORYI|nr:hypothetical protein BT93_L2495 [Corymbia citriodora subsp. variegata]
MSCLLLASSQGVSSSVQLVKGLSWSFFKKTCSEVESIIKEHLKKVFQDDISQLQGSYVSISTTALFSKQDAPPNPNLRRTTLKIINDLRNLMEKKCGRRVVSFADIATIAARDSIFLSGGPKYEVPLGRRDKLAFASVNETTENLPSPTQNASQILAALTKKSFDTIDVVALSRAHSIGLGHCGAFTKRLYPTPNSTMDKNFTCDLKGVCPATNSTNTIILDIRSPNRFDNKYFVNLVNRQSLFTSDQDLYEDPTTWDIVTSFAKDLELFFQKFVLTMTKMGQLAVLTMTKGEIRAHYSVRNS